MPIVRLALPADLPRIKQIDGLCFPVGDLEHEPATPNELDESVAHDRVLVIEEGGQVGGFLHYERPTQDHVYLSAVATHPDFRRSGFARALIEAFLTRVRSADEGAVLSLSTVTSINNLPMISLLLLTGFVVRTQMKGYFGPGRDRVYCQFKVRVEYLDPDERYIIPVDATEHVDRLLADERFVITSLAQLPHGRAFEFSRFDRDDFGALEAGETSAGLGFAGVVLGAIAFLLGFSFASQNYPDAARTLLTGAAFATTVSLIVYANTSGEAARIRSNMFGYFMKWGNVLSEYGGVLPFLIALPITLAAVTHTRVPAAIAAAIFSLGLVAYERSRFSMSSRFRRTLVTRGYAAVICLAPFVGVLLIELQWAMWIWTGVVSLALSMLAATFLFWRPNESSGEPRRATWEPRR